MIDAQVSLLHIRDAIVQIETYAKGGNEEFFSNRMLQDAVIRNLEIIGEAAKKLPPDLRDRRPEVPWARIAGEFTVRVKASPGIARGFAP